MWFNVAILQYHSSILFKNASKHCHLNIESNIVLIPAAQLSEKI